MFPYNTSKQSDILNFGGVMFSGVASYLRDDAKLFVVEVELIEIWFA